MDTERFIRAMPKVELNARLEGYYRKDVLMLIADENEVAAETKHFKTLAGEWDQPDFAKFDAFVRGYMSWLVFPDDLTRLVYDVGVALSRENVKYAEVSINSVFHRLSGMSFEDFMTALNDGRDRVERAWGLKINWVMTVPRDVPRSADDALRWAASVTGKKTGVVAFGISGSEGAQPAGQFKRAFDTAIKKEIPTVAQAGDVDGAEGVVGVLDLGANRIVDAWGITEDPDGLTNLVENSSAVAISLGRARALGWVTELADYPLQALVDAGVKVVLSAEMPAFYGMTLSDNYIAAVNEIGLSIGELETIALNGIEASYLDEPEKAQLLEEFRAEYARLREEMMSSSEAQ